jgi:hypothetical protein
MTRTTPLVRRTTTAYGALAALMCAALLQAAPASAQMTRNDMYSAPVPRLCGHHAGRLVDGKLPGIRRRDGVVEIASRKLIALGTLVKGQGRGAAMTMYCDRGGVSWPNLIVFYTPHRKVINTFDLGSLLRSEHASAHRIWINRRVVHVQVTGMTRPGECGACSSGAASLELRWSTGKHRVVLTRKHLYTEHTAAARFVRAVNHRDRRTARRVADKRAVSTAFAIRRSGKFTLGVCRPASTGSHLRTCAVHPRAPGKRAGLRLGMDKVGWNRWRVSSATAVERGPAGTT